MPCASGPHTVDPVDVSGPLHPLGEAPDGQVPGKYSEGSGVGGVLASIAFLLLVPLGLGAGSGDAGVRRGCRWPLWLVLGSIDF